MNKMSGKDILYLFLTEKKLRVMKLICFLLTVFLFHTTAGTYAQTMRLNLNLKQSTVKHILKEIEAKSDFTFFYNDSEIDMDRVVDIRVKNENIETVLSRILPHCDYVVENKKIILIPVSESRVQAGVLQSGHITVQGTVMDEYGDPLPGVNINILGTTQGVVSDLDGNYHISVPSNGSLVFSFIGYTRQTIAVEGRSVIDVTLTEDVLLVDEVVVVGFAKQKKSNLTGSVSSIKVDEVLGDRPVTTAGNLLQGTMPGLQTTVDTGEPGAGYSFNIRGTTSINGGSPLILVDNVPFAGAIELINPEDIESITILKDGGAAAIYGSRSAFGVILITTKSAELNQKFQLTYNNNFTFSSPSELPVKASPRDAVQAFKDMGLMSNYTGQNIDEWLGYLDAYEANPSLYPNGYVINEQGTRYALRESDLLGDFFQTGFQQKHNVSLQGGSSVVSYRLSFGYVDEDGVMVTKKDRFQRYNFRTFLSAKITDWLTAQADVSYIKSDKSMPNNADYQWAVAYPSYTEMVDLDINGEIYPAGTPGNKVRLGGTNLNQRANTRMTGKLIATPLKGLTLNAEFTYDDLRRTQTNYNKRIKISIPNKYEPEAYGETSTLTKENYTTTHSTWNVYGSYNRGWGKHNFTGLFGFNQEIRNYEKIKNIGTYFISDEMPAFSLAQDQAERTSDEYQQYNLRGYFGRINYDYDNRYLLELNGRYDGSSKFQSGHRWGFFPSVSVAWRVMQEPFMESLMDYVPEFKVRLSYSTVGNQNIDPYLFNPSMGGEKANWIVDGDRPTTLKPPGLVTDNFTWETIETYNFGLDISLLRNRLQANFDLYRRNTKDMLAVAMELPAVVGASAPQQNVADLRSEGFELEVKWNDRIGKVNYYIGANLYNYSSKITNIYNEAGLFRARNEQYTLESGNRRYRTGMKIGEIWGYTFDRYYTEDDFVDGVLKEGIARPDGVNPNPGDILFVDYDGDGIIRAGANAEEDPGDQRIIGNSSLKLQYGITGGASWNNFSFSFILQGVGKRDLWLANDLTQAFNYEYGTIYAHQLDYWTPENPPCGLSPSLSDR